MTGVKRETFPVVIIPMCTFPSMLMCRKLFYTAVTRAKQMVVLVGTKESVVRMVNNEGEGKRYTGLEEKLRGTVENEAVKL